MKIKQSKLIWTIVIFLTVALVATYSVRAEFDASSAKIRITRSILGIKYHTAHWDTWLSQYITPSGTPVWNTVELRKDPVSLWSRDRGSYSPLSREESKKPTDD